MKAVILAGGLGTRLSEETHSRPKPMVEIGGKPILWHIMKIFESYGVNDFIVCCGYKGFFIKEYFDNYHLRNTDVTFNIKDNSSSILRNTKENWLVTCVDTGDDTLTGGRLKKIKEFLDPNEPFLFTYGDGVGNINRFGVLGGSCVIQVKSLTSEKKDFSKAVKELDHTLNDKYVLVCKKNVSVLKNLIILYP